jgi:arylsulfatase A-like enzyme
LVIFPSHTYGLPTEERTLLQALKEAGYRTAMVGKWHLGHTDQKYWPQNRGFEHVYGNLVGEVDYFTKERGGVIDWQRNGQFLKEDGYFTSLIGDEAVRLIEGHDATKPLFLYVASLAPHAPYQAPKEYVDRYNPVADEKRRTYAAMITALDDQVGRIVGALEKKGMRDNTLIVFSSDNGGATSALFATGARSEAERKAEGIQQGAKPPASNGAFRGGKGSLHEGGVRVPTFANWPGRLQPAVIDQPLHMVDLMPTLLALAGARGSTDRRWRWDWSRAKASRSTPACWRPNASRYHGKAPGDLDWTDKQRQTRAVDTKAFLKSRDQRKRVEMRFAHLKTHHGFERLRLRGLSGARDEFHLAAIVQNLKTLALRLIRLPPLGSSCRRPKTCTVADSCAAAKKSLIQKIAGRRVKSGKFRSYPAVKASALTFAGCEAPSVEPNSRATAYGSTSSALEGSVCGW